MKVSYDKDYSLSQEVLQAWGKVLEGIRRICVAVSVAVLLFVGISRWLVVKA